MLLTLRGPYIPQRATSDLPPEPRFVHLALCVTLNTMFAPPPQVGGKVRWHRQPRSKRMKMQSYLAYGVVRDAIMATMSYVGKKGVVLGAWSSSTRTAGFRRVGARHAKVTPTLLLAPNSHLQNESRKLNAIRHEEAKRSQSRSFRLKAFRNARRDFSAVCIRHSVAGAESKLFLRVALFASVSAQIGVSARAYIR